MVPTYHRLWRCWPIRAMLAVGGVADAGWRRAISATCPSLNLRDEAHHDEDFHASGITIGAPSAVQQPRLADRTNEDNRRLHRKPSRDTGASSSPRSSKPLVPEDAQPPLNVAVRSFEVTGCSASWVALAGSTLTATSLCRKASRQPCSSFAGLRTIDRTCRPDSRSGSPPATLDRELGCDPLRGTTKDQPFLKPKSCH